MHIVFIELHICAKEEPTLFNNESDASAGNFRVRSMFLGLKVLNAASFRMKWRAMREYFRAM